MALSTFAIGLLVSTLRQACARDFFTHNHRRAARHPEFRDLQETTPSYNVEVEGISLTDVDTRIPDVSS